MPRRDLPPGATVIFVLIASLPAAIAILFWILA